MQTKTIRISAEPSQYTVSTLCMSLHKCGQRSLPTISATEVGLKIYSGCYLMKG